MISVCLPSRARPDRFAEMTESARRTATTPIEFCVYLDTDERGEYPTASDVRYQVGGCTRQSEMWNAAWALARGDIAMLAGDDLIFETMGWSEAVERIYAAVPDRLVHVWCDDGTIHSNIATHPFVSRRWIEIVGFFTPPYYQVWNADSWLLDLGYKISRQVYLPKHLIRHCHPDYGSAADDDTYRRLRELRPVGRPRVDQRPEWASREEERVEQARRLYAAMDPVLWERSPFDSVYPHHGFHRVPLA